MNTGLYGEKNLTAVSDPDIVLIGNQWWMIFATGPAAQPRRALEPFAAYLPPGASLSTTTTYPSDPNGWRFVGAQADGNGVAAPVSPIPGTPLGPNTHSLPPQWAWDQIAAETPSVNVGPDGKVSVYYSGHNAGETEFKIGLMPNFANGLASGVPDPVMSAVQPWEFSSGLSAILEQSVRWIPSLNKFVMLYTAGAWWANPPDNTIGYAESSDGINWVNRQKFDFPISYYNQDFLYNESHRRYEMVISKDPTNAGGANPRNIVWRSAASLAASQSQWLNEVTLLQYNAPDNAPWYNSGILSPSMKYGNLPGETNRLYVFFHSYTQDGNMFIGRFYCDATPSATPTFSLTSSAPALSLATGAGSTVNIAVNPQSTFNASVNFSAAGFPAGVSSTFLQPSSTTGTTLVFYAPDITVPGRYPITVTGRSGSLTQTTTFTLSVTQ